jgi:hypothetical protein
MSFQTVHVRVNDAATGQPTPVRLRVTDADGTYFAPFGHAVEFPCGRGEAVGGDVMIGGERWAYIDGACEIALPPGRLTVEVRKGSEYRPLRDSVHLPAGKLALRFAIERATNWRAQGWFSGETRAHELSPHAALLEAAAEDLAVVHVLAREVSLHAADGRTYTTHPNLVAFSGQKPCLERDGHGVCVGTLNRHPVLGSLGLLHCHRVVYPLVFGGPDGTDDWSLADWCGQCHRKKGLVVWVNAFDAKAGHAGEALADLIRGEIDALELDPNSPHRVRHWYQLLNAGLRVPLVGASAKASNRTPLGALRTVARLDPATEFDLTAWIEAVRAGRTFVTTGPFLAFEVDGTGPGAVIQRPSGVGPLRARFGARGQAPIHRVELIANGAVVTSGQGAAIDYQFELPAGGWVAARCLDGGRLLAHTSPVYVQVEGARPPVDRSAVAFLDDHLKRTRDWVVTEGHFNHPKSRDHLLEIIDSACQQLAARDGI